MIYNNVLDLIGNTPIVKLNKILPSYINKNIFVKLEGYNPGGSSKDRVAKNIIEMAEKEGKLKEGGTIVESSSGNLAIGLSLVAKQKGYNMICVIDPKISDVNLSLIKALGAETIMVEQPDESGNYLKARIKMAQQLASSVQSGFWPNQYNTPYNPGAYSETLAREVFQDFKGKLDWIICSVGTAGLVTGLSRGLKKLIPTIKTLAVDAKGSVIFGTPPKVRHIIGMGNAIVPGNLDLSLYDKITHVGDAEAFRTTRDLAVKEGLVVGGSSGATVYAALELAKEISEESNILAVLPDRGDRYYNTLFSNEWLDDRKIDIQVDRKNDGIVFYT
ncbi:2,3-diaminopropionate biosynthesis protein SbnA [Chengkuizengella sp. SCS-71B]|uniref:2,3-diaminopropionate biosynthesis protein SbnA n=1 Tax=Chengkuizengella sp. SCS-71B TaxID=3115290 RepID=UPI0032C248B9